MSSFKTTVPVLGVLFIAINLQFVIIDQSNAAPPPTFMRTISGRWRERIEPTSRVSQTVEESFTAILPDEEVNEGITVSHIKLKQIQSKKNIRSP
jgi:hypothetical protein